MILLLPVWLKLALGFGVGACLGSFVNVLAHRLPIMRGFGVYEGGAELKRLKVFHDHFNVLVPRSYCPSCKVQIKNRFNIPVLGWLLTRAKCASCKKPISFKYPLMECLVGLAFAASFYDAGFSLVLIPCAIKIVGIFTMISILFEHQRLDRTVMLVTCGAIAAEMLIHMYLPG